MPISQALEVDSELRRLGKFSHVTTEHGLSQGSVHDVVQDATGFIWIGTDDGLNRYDGYRVTVFKHDPNDIRSISDNEISDLFLDGDNRLWIATWGGGLNLYEPDTESFTRFSSNPTKQGDPGGTNFRVVYGAPSGELWIGTWGDGLRKFDPETGSSIVVNLHTQETNLEKVRVFDVVSNNDDSLWIGAWQHGLLRLNVETGEVAPISLGTVDPATSAVTSLARMVDGRIAVGTDGAGLVFVDPSSNTVELVGPPGTQVRDIYQDSTGVLWVASLGSGLLRLPAEGGKWDIYRNNVADRHSISMDDVYSLYEDRSGSLWIGTLGAGINRIHVAGQPFEHYWSDPTNSNSLSHNGVRAFAGDRQGNIWIGTDGGGLSRLNRDQVVFENFGVDRGLLSDRVWALHIDRFENVWYGTWGQGLGRLNTETGLSEAVDLNSPGTNNSSNLVITSLLEGPADTIWVGTLSDGVKVVDKETGAVSSFRYNPENDQSLSGDYVMALANGTDGSIWAGTWKAGLNRIDPSTGIVSRFGAVAGDSTTLSDSTVRSLYAAGDGALWVGTSRGLNRFDLATGLVTASYLETDGLPNNVVYAIQEDKNGQLWISTNNGLARFAPQIDKFTSYSSVDGLQGREFNNGASFSSANGTLFFGGPNGFNAFRPSEVRENTVAPLTAITEFKLFNQPADWRLPDSPLSRPITATKSITLSHAQNVFSLEFSGFHFSNPNGNTYEYRLDGFNDEWIETDAGNRLASYTNLSPGEYLFRVRAANSDGIWGAGESQLALVILPPWWRTWWAYSAYVFILIAAFIAYAAYRTRRVRLRARALQIMVRERTARIQDQKRTIEEQAGNLKELLEAKNHLFAQVSHEFRTPLTLILGPAEALQKQANNEGQKKQLGIIRRSATRLLRLVDQMLGLAQTEISAESPASPQPFSVLVVNTVDAFSEFAAENNIHLKYDVQPDIWLTCHAESLEHILLNLISNAVKYTRESGSIEVRVTAVPDKDVVLSISDSGIGIPDDELQKIFEPFHRVANEQTQSTPGSGIGLALVQELVQAEGGRITVNSEVGQGSQFEIVFPNSKRVSPGTGSGVAQPGREVVEEVRHLSSTQTADEPQPSCGSVTSTADSPTILVVEDNNDMRHYVCSILEKDYIVLQSENGIEGLEQARETVPDLVVSDVMMPGKDGFELTLDLKTDDRTCHIPVILLTAKHDKPSRQLGFEHKADAYITKPFEEHELTVRVSNLLGFRERIKSRLRQQLLSEPDVVLSSTDSDLPKRDQVFLERVRSFLGKHYSNADLNLAEIAHGVAMSDRQLQRKMKAIVNCSPSEYLRVFRLHKARELLESGQQVGVVALDVGFSSQAYFGSCFKTKYGVTPGQYASRRLA